MKIDGVAHRSIWPAEHGRSVHIIDQTRLPHGFVTTELATLDAAATAIRDMWVRGAPLIGATAAYGLAMALARDPSDAGLAKAAALLAATRPTAINLRWALDAVTARVAPLAEDQRAAAAWAKAGEICEEDVAVNHAIGRHGLALIREIAARKRQGKGGGEPVNILTHCNAGWLATVDWGTATSPIYQAHDAGIPVHVWVDETRPRNQGAGLTAWELGRHGVPHRLVVDNAGGHLMQHGLVDMVIVGTDRTTATGDVCNKIGTYLKALAAHDNGVPFHVALPSSTIDWTVRDGLREIPIEERSGREVTHLTGLTQDGRVETVAVTPPTTEAANPAFDVTPARLVTSLITERGICAASADGLASLFPERRAA
ncbi:S-methyl-5-thioribose-1-phosphate isomerase [Stappia sp. TSB10P1A]|uniref:S-methyl-5-thioribose-1-phosphate isomerase n=1 Tax=Stappia sp. TSB10P1A TaxID=2003585 RepID=UPI0016438933|nr:S-methyl-5-thioribose-1-phosphate isomerase [Stappia sp. TSB10P1A]